MLERLQEGGGVLAWYCRSKGVAVCHVDHTLPIRTDDKSILRNSGDSRLEDHIRRAESVHDRGGPDPNISLAIFKQRDRGICTKTVLQGEALTGRFAGYDWKMDFDDAAVKTSSPKLIRTVEQKLQSPAHKDFRSAWEGGHDRPRREVIFRIIQPVLHPHQA